LLTTHIDVLCTDLTKQAFVTYAQHSGFLLNISRIAASQKQNADGTQRIIESIDWKTKMNAIDQMARPNVIG